MEAEWTQELLSVTENRRTIYVFLATIYAKELTKQFLLELAKKKDFFLKLANDSETASIELTEGFKGIADFAATIKEDKEVLDRIHLEQATEYAGLFLGVRHTPPHPSESAYTSSDHLIMQKPRDDALLLYRRMGLKKNRGFTEPEDHIALELQLMAHLCQKTTEAIKASNQADARKYLEVQRDFLNDHLGVWVPSLAADIIKSGRRPFYVAVAKVTKEYVNMDKEMVLELIGALPP